MLKSSGLVIIVIYKKILKVLLQYVGGGEEDQVEGGVDEAGTRLVALNFLEIYLRKLVKPVGHLNDKVELEEVGHLQVAARVLAPDAGDGEEVSVPADDLTRPDERHENEGEQLPGLIELGVLRLGEVQLTGDFLKF